MLNQLNQLSLEAEKCFGVWGLKSKLTNSSSTLKDVVPKRKTKCKADWTAKKGNFIAQYSG